MNLDDFKFIVVHFGCAFGLEDEMMKLDFVLKVKVIFNLEVNSNYDSNYT